MKLVKLESEKEFGGEPHVTWINPDNISSVEPMGNYGSLVTMGSGAYFRIRVMPEKLVIELLGASGVELS